MVGCTHQLPAFANRTICWPERAPVTRPDMGARLSGPPSAAGGTTLNSIAGLLAAWRVVQPVREMWRHVPTTNAKKQRALTFGRDHFNRSSPFASLTRLAGMRQLKLDKSEIKTGALSYYAAPIICHKEALKAQIKKILFVLCVFLWRITPSGY